jgi:hypothetical protein
MDSTPDKHSKIINSEIDFWRAHVWVIINMSYDKR